MPGWTREHRDPNSLEVWRELERLVTTHFAIKLFFVIIITQYVE